jgi:flagellar assembly factor FliW
MGEKLLRFSTTRFGELELGADRILSFPQGLIGFAEARRFTLIDHPGGGPFRWLQSLDAPELAFVVADPQLFFADYRVPLSVEDLRSIGLERIEDGAVVVILVVPRDPLRITANLLGPIVINLKGRLARQLVLDSSGYTTQHAIFAGPEPLLSAGRKEARC